MGWFDEAGGGQSANVLELLESSEVWPQLVAIVESGALLSMGLTSDGGALGVTVTVDGRYRRQYFRQVEELAEFLGEATVAVRAEVEALAASSGRGSRQRRRTRAT